MLTDKRQCPNIYRIWQQIRVPPRLKMQRRTSRQLEKIWKS
ncbi:hypothetical protein ACHAXN_008187 [Cyclotella atomus]